MSSYNPPIENTPIFNPDNFVDITDQTDGLTIGEADLRYLIKATPDIANVIETFSAGIETPSLNSNTNTLNIGTDLSNVNINIGNATSSTTIFGPTTYIDVTNLNIKDPNILVNKNGFTPLNAGLQVESSGSIVSSLLNDSNSDWIVSSANNKIYLDNISEKTANHNIISSSNINVNKGTGTQSQITERQFIVTDGAVITELKNDIPSTHGMVGTRSTHPFEIHTDNTPRITLSNNGISTFSNTTASTLKTNGSVVLAGGLGVAEKINCTSIQTTSNSVFPGISLSGGSLFSVYTIYNGYSRILLDSVAQTLKMGTGSTTFNDWLTMDSIGKTSIVSNIASTSSTTGSLVVTGGIGVSKSLYSGENIEATGNIVARNRLLAYGTGDATSTWEMAPGYKAGTITPGYVTYNVAGTTTGVHYFNDKVEMSSLSIPNGATDSQSNAGLFVYSNTTDATANGLPTGSTGCSNNIVYGFRNNFLSTDATDSTFSYYGFQGGSTPDPDFMISYKYGRGMLIYNSTTAEIDAWGAVGAQERLRVSGTAKVTGAFSTDGLSTFNAGIDMAQQNITNAYKVQNGNTSLIMDTSNNLTLGTSATSRLTIDSTGITTIKGETKIEEALRPAKVITQDKFTTSINCGTFQSTFYQWCNHFTRNNVGSFNFITISHSPVSTDVFTGTLFLDINICVFTATGTCSARSFQTQITFFKENGSFICTVGSNSGTSTAVNSPSGVTIGGPTFNFAPAIGSLGINMFAPTMTGGTLSHFNVSYSARVVFSSGDNVNSAIGGLVTSISYIV